MCIASAGQIHKLYLNTPSPEPSGIRRAIHKLHSKLTLVLITGNEVLTVLIKSVTGN